VKSLEYYWDFFVRVERTQLEILWSIPGKSFDDGFYWPIWILVGFLLWEFVAPWRPKQRKLRPQVGVDAFYTIFNYALLWLLVGNALFSVIQLALNHALLHYFGVRNLVAIELNTLPLWIRYVLMFLATDFTSYFGHVILHRVNFLWEFHKVHHAATELDVLNANRVHWVELFFYPLVFMIPLGMVGFNAGDVFIGTTVITILSNFTHANVKLPLGPLKYVINSPQFHLWHHAMHVNAQRNVNYGDAFCFWDYLFGTAYMPDDRSQLELGFPGVEDYPSTYLGQMVQPFVTIFSGVKRKLLTPFS